MTLQQTPPATDKQLTPPLCSVFHVWTTSQRAAQINRAAEQFQVHPDHMLAEIINAIADRNLFSALLAPRKRG